MDETSVRWWRRIMYVLRWWDALLCAWALRARMYRLRPARGDVVVVQGYVPTAWEVERVNRAAQAMGVVVLYLHADSVVTVERSRLDREDRGSGAGRRTLHLGVPHDERT